MTFIIIPYIIKFFELKIILSEKPKIQKFVISYLFLLFKQKFQILKY